MKRKYSFLVFLFSFYFIASGQNYQDQENAFNVCEPKSYQFKNMDGPGKVIEEFKEESCFGSRFSETNSKWLKWSPISDGQLILSILPDRPSDDIDFIVFKSTLEGKISPIRCMASGHTLNSKAENYCEGITGLAFSSMDEYEMKGCNEKDDNYLKFLNMKVGEVYYLLINNYDSSMGFSITIETDALLNRESGCQNLDLDQTLQLERIFPNPSSDLINVDYLSKENQEIQLAIYDVVGHKHISIVEHPNTRMNNVSIDIQSLPTGEYILLASQNGNSSTKRFIKI